MIAMRGCSARRRIENKPERLQEPVMEEQLVASSPGKDS
jgi:hypothetical protein